MSERDRNREWLTRENERSPEGWSAKFVAAFGMEGALDLLAAQGGDPYGVLLARRPFSSNHELKDAVRDARLAATRMSRLAFQVGWDATRKES
ncbi:hypothetical protein [Microbacterium sp. MMO-10]|uniref:hypothetical protein n=1 Tax=Microbacterium sp. MMO-10 TaxID=3081272 RepID=UPI003017AA6F